MLLHRPGNPEAEPRPFRLYKPDFSLPLIGIGAVTKQYYLFLVVRILFMSSVITGAYIACKLRLWLQIWGRVFVLFCRCLFSDIRLENVSLGLSQRWVYSLICATNLCTCFRIIKCSITPHEKKCLMWFNVATKQVIKQQISQLFCKYELSKKKTSYLNNYGVFLNTTFFLFFVLDKKIYNIKFTFPVLWQ